MKIIIGADLVPTKSNYDDFIKGNIQNVIDTNLKNILDSEDYRIFNLEVPLTDLHTPIKKNGPNLIAPTQTICGIKEIGVDLFTLANNHIMDQDKQGLYSTISILEKSGIAYFGVGNDLKEASKPYIIEKDDLKIGVYACTEHEFSVATNNSPGANPFDYLESFECVKALKQKCNYVIVLYHGGKEHYRYPSPELQRICRKFCDDGADVVICQHSHCIGCEEKYRDGTIVYGQGNFLFDHSKSEFWQTSLLIEIEFTNQIAVKYIPICKKGKGVCITSGADKIKILDDFYKRSKEIENDNFVIEYYESFSANCREHYLNGIYGTSVFWRILNKLCGHKLKRKISQRKLLILRNFIECEAHREMLLRGIEK